MNLLAPDPDPTEPARLDLELERVCDRLRTMSLVRLSAPLHGPATGVGPAPDRWVTTPTSRAGAARALAQELADRAAELAGQPHRTLPHLPDPSVADLLAVCGHDLSAQVRRHGGDAAGVCSVAVQGLVGLRLLL